MIEGVTPYSAMKDSGIAWLGRVPSHWSTPRLKTVFREVDHRSGTGEEPLLSLRMRQGLVDHHAMGGKPIPASSLVNYKRTQSGDLVMNRMRAATGLFAATRTVGLVSPDYAVLRPRSQVDLQYFVHLFRTPLMMSVFRLESRGLGTGESGFLRLYTERFGMLATPFPPPDE
jgi:type I restriction enzyme S subunit